MFNFPINEFAAIPDQDNTGSGGDDDTGGGTE